MFKLFIMNDWSKQCATSVIYRIDHLRVFASEFGVWNTIELSN